MTNIILKLRNLIGDILKTDGRDVFDYESISSSKIFTLTESNVYSPTIIVYKNGLLWSMTPISGTGVSWTRLSSIITITKNSHGLLTGDSITIRKSVV